ncbi:MAG: cation transporter, partial [Alkalibacterium sp.]
KLNGLHCSNCSDELEKKLNKFTTHSKLAIDYDTGILTVDETEADLERIKKILEFEKITLSDPEHEHNSDHSGHDHHHGHHHDMSSLMNQESSKKMLFVFSINLAFSAIEFLFGFLFNSFAIMTDAVHDLGDALSIGLAAYFEKLSTKEANDQYSFGHQRFSLLGAFVTAVVLLGGSMILLVTAVPRLIEPVEVNQEGMFWLSIFAIGANGFSAWLMSRGESHNESLLSLHMLEDVLGWLGVLVVSILLNYTDWYFLDPLLSMGIATFIIYKTWPLFKETIEIFLEATPKNLSREKIEATILSIDGVTNVSHLHVWSIDGREHAMTVTVSTSLDKIDRIEAIKETIRHDLSKYGIHHSTIEVVYDAEGTLAKM